MRLEWRARSRSLAWSNPVAWWWSLLTLVSAINIAAWFSLYHYLQKPRPAALGSTSGGAEDRGSPKVAAGRRAAAIAGLVPFSGVGSSEPACSIFQTGLS